MQNKKIDLTYKTEHKGYIYLCSTNCCKTCKQAKAMYLKDCKKHIQYKLLYAKGYFSKDTVITEIFNPKNLRANFDKTA